MQSHVSYPCSNGVRYTRSSLAYLLVKTAASHRSPVIIEDMSATRSTGFGPTPATNSIIDAFKKAPQKELTSGTFTENTAAASNENDRLSCTHGNHCIDDSAGSEPEIFDENHQATTTTPCHRRFRFASVDLLDTWNYCAQAPEKKASIEKNHEGTEDQVEGETSEAHLTFAEPPACVKAGQFRCMSANLSHPCTGSRNENLHREGASKKRSGQTTTCGCEGREVPLHVCQPVGLALPTCRTRAQAPETKASIEKATQEAPMPCLGERIMIIKEPWLQLILNKLKTMEIRCSPAELGKTWLAFDGQVFGAAYISNCVQITREEFEATREQHQHLGDMPPHARVYALTLQNIVRLESPVPHYRPPTTAPWTIFRTEPAEKAIRGPKRKRALQASQEGTSVLPIQGMTLHETPSEQEVESPTCSVISTPNKDDEKDEPTAKKQDAKDKDNKNES
ncbi:unnamed protein product [Symbiodinium natans]|uniref:Uncharacterized protein n=1 Tax=Symbiodinium natans TaxID=878477 RepID=A0A812LRX4_9DINO|nr:unnamed protein product [Symbiodinium natans]